MTDRHYAHQTATAINRELMRGGFTPAIGIHVLAEALAYWLVDQTTPEAAAEATEAIGRIAREYLADIAYHRTRRAETAP